MRALAAVTLTAIGTVVAAAAVTDPAAAVTACTVRGSLPARVSIGAARVAVRSVLTPSAGCLHPGDENSAAFLYDGARLVDVAVWNRFGDVYTVDLAARTARAGTYTMRDGVALVWDASAQAYSDTVWGTTATVVKYAGRVASVTASRTGTLTTVRATLTSYHPAVNAYLPLAGVAVVVERAHRYHDDWVAVGHRTTSATGRIALPYRTAGHWVYRVRSVTTAVVWGATSAGVYR